MPDVWGIILVLCEGDDIITTIFCDSREPRSIPEYLTKTFPKTTFVTQCLKEGDYRSDKVLCERKKIGDLYGSIMDKRIWSQVNRMAQFDDMKLVLLITGNLDEYIKSMRRYKKFINEKIIYSCIDDIACRYNFEVMWIEDEKNALNILVGYMESADAGNNMVPTKAHPEALIARYLGITIPQYLELRTKYGSLTKIAKITATELSKVKGIGAVKSKKILTMLNVV
jgi:ERCC4-type nuclease